MPRCDTTEDSSTSTVLLYGPPLGGKSTLVSLLAEYYKLIWVDVEKGSAILYKLPKSWQKNIELIKIPDTRSLPIGTQTVRKMVKGPVKICTLHGNAGCSVCMRNKAEITSIDITKKDPRLIVVFDSATQLVNSTLAHITKTEGEDYKEEWDDWGVLGKLMDVFFSHIQNGGFNCVVISHELEITKTVGKKQVLDRVVPIGGTGNFSRNVAKYFDHVIYMTKEGKRHVAFSGTDYKTHIMTGSRTDFRIEDLAVPSLLPIFGIPEGAVSGECLWKDEVEEEGRVIEGEVVPESIQQPTPKAVIKIAPKQAGSVVKEDLLAKIKAARNK